MKILGIVCSPRLHGNTEVLVNASLATAQEEGAETELVTLSGKAIAVAELIKQHFMIKLAIDKNRKSNKEVDTYAGALRKNFGCGGFR